MFFTFMFRVYRHISYDKIPARQCKRMPGLMVQVVGCVGELTKHLEILLETVILVLENSVT